MPKDRNLKWLSFVFMAFAIIFPLVLFNSLIALITDIYAEHKMNEKAEDTRDKIVLVIEGIATYNTTKRVRRKLDSILKGCYQKFCQKKPTQLGEPEKLAQSPAETKPQPAHLYSACQPHINIGTPGGKHIRIPTPDNNRSSPAQQNFRRRNAGEKTLNSQNHD